MLEASCIRFAWDLEAERIAWSPAPRPAPSFEGTVHLWQIDLGAAGSGLLALAGSVLSAEERARAGRFVSPALAERFMLCRGLLRYVVGGSLGCKPAEVVFTYGPFGKPFVRDDAPAPLRFNLSHTERLGLIAVARGREVGVDVEALDRGVDVMALARRYFSDAEIVALSDTAPEQRMRLFVHLWTSKEAILKCRGTGVSELHLLKTGRPLDPSVSVRHVPMPFHHVGAVAVAPPGDHAGAI